MSEAAARPHDLGGLPAEPLDVADHDMAPWEKEANAMRLTLVGGPAPRITLDELRRAAEDLGDDYHRMAYFERTTAAARVVLTERGYLTADQIDQRIGQIKDRLESVPDAAPPARPDHHGHLHEEPEDRATDPYAILNKAMQELLIEKDLLTADDIRAGIEAIDEKSEGALGARVVARAWADPAYKARLLDDGGAACREIGIPVGDLELIAVENTPEVHNVIVCTLCSCYPRPLLGMPPHWYKSRSYRSRCVVEPRALLKEFGLHLSDDVTIRVHDSNADMRYIVVPERPVGTEGWDEDRLAGLVTRDCMIGVTQPTAAF